MNEWSLKLLSFFLSPPSAQRLWSSTTNGGKFKFLSNLKAWFARCFIWHCSWDVSPMKKKRCFVTFEKNHSLSLEELPASLSLSLSLSLWGQTGCINAFEVAKVVCKQMEKVYTEFKRPSGFCSGRLAGGKWNSYPSY